MTLRDPESPSPEEQAGPPSQADRRMADLLSDKTHAGSLRENLRDEGTPVADDLLGRLNAMDFIDSVLGEDYELPSRIGDFEITGVLGRGGMGTVYKAYQATLDREVALKVLAPRFSSDVTMRKRFRIEAKATAAMHHQHIVPIYGYGEASGHLFFAMELVEGVSLDKHITVSRRKSQGAMEPLEAARRFAGVADALALAHKRQILHRDVKPGNLLVHGDGTLALADFGLSKFLGEVSAHLTSIGGFLGTLHYSPPEQARGEDLGPASDMYSLGVTIFETVTGKLPVYGQSTEAMLHALLHDEPLRLRDLMPKAPRDLGVVVEKLLSKEPRDRYQDGEALALDLIRIAEGEPVRIRRESLVSRLYRRAKRNPVVAGALGIALILLVVTVLWFQSLLENKVIERERQGREALARASVAVAREPGSPWGPFGVLTALSGGRSEDGSTSSGFLRELETATAMLPDESTEIERFRNAYAGAALQRCKERDVLVVDLLRRGEGARAVKVLDAAIDQLEKLYQTDDLGVKIDLYNLYLTRALASLSGSVGEVQQARYDLNRATLIRAGAVLPRMLEIFLAWDVRTQAELLLHELGKFVKEHDSAAITKACGEFLLAFAGMCPPPPCQMMRFPMDFATRRTLTGRALEWLGGKPEGYSEAYFGVDYRLAEIVTRILNDPGDSDAVHAKLSTGRAMLANVREDSPLLAWKFTLDLLDADSDSARQELDAAQRLRGAIHFVRVVQRTLSIDEAEALLANHQARFLAMCEAVRKTAKPADERLGQLATELRARVNAWIGDVDVALQDTQAWLGFADQVPAAYLYKVCALVRAVPKDAEERLRVLRYILEVKNLGFGWDTYKSWIRQRIEHVLPTITDANVKPHTQALLKVLADPQ